MPRNIRWDESVKENALNLVEALLYQADDELDDLALKAAVHLEWLTENKLRVTGKEKQKRGKREQIVEVGTRKEHLVKLVNKAGKSLKLPQRKKESGSSQPERELEEVQTALDCLRELGVFEEEKNTRKNQGYWKFTLTLKHQTATREENLEVVRQKWKEHPKTNSLVTSSTTSIQVTEKSIDWRDICRTMLEKQKRLTTNELLSADEDMKFELDDIHVPLALVQRTKPDKRSGDVSPQEGSRLLQPTYEEKQRFKHEEFLAQVLQEGKGQSKGKRIAVIGEPGAGKTTLLQSIAFWLFEDKNQNLGLPIWISLADLQGKTVEEYLLQRWLKNALEVARVTPEQENALVDLFKSERVWLFLDGVDEIAGGSVGVGAQGIAPLQVVASQLEGWVAKARVVLSCRLNVWEANINALGDDFETYRLLDFDYPLQVKEFICRWFRKTDADKGERLWTELDKSERQRIQDLVKNPLRLALLCSTWQSSDKGLPSTKAGLYEQFLKEFYRWKENRFPTTEDQQEELNAALGRLAKRAIDQEASRFRLRHQLLREELGDQKQQGSLFWLALQLGWLNQVGLAAESETQEKVYAFYHPTFQEYFAALAIDDWDFFLPRSHDNHKPKPVSERYRIFEPQWKEMILLWLGREEVMKEQKEEFINALVEFEDGCNGFYWYQTYFLAAVGIAEFRNCNRTEEIIALIVTLGFGYFDDEEKEWARFYYLIEYGAREALRESYRSQVATELIDLLDTTQNEFICNLVAYDLGRIEPGHKQAINALTDLLKKSQNEFICGFSAYNLGQIEPGNKQAINAIIKLMYKAKAEHIRFSAVSSLGKIGSGNEQELIALINLRDNTKSESSRRLVNKSLGLLGADNEQVVTPLIKRLDTEQDEDTRRQAAHDLGEIDSGNEQAIAVLIDLLNTAHDEFTRRQAAQSLGVIATGNEQALTALINLLDKTRNESTRRQAAQSLGVIDPGNEKAITTLINLLNNTQDGNQNRKLIAKSLGQIGSGNEQAITALINLLNQTQNNHTREITAKSLGQIGSGNEQAITALIKLLKQTQNNHTREIAAKSLQTIVQSDYLHLAVTTFKVGLNHQVHKNDFDFYKSYYEIIWHCAQNMTYPDFYQAWHQQEGVGKTTTLDRQRLNQANLPQSLQAAIANDPQLSQTLHLICIDGSQFIEPDRPAAEIYDQMLDQNCPECDSVPETMPALKLYWNSLKRKTDKRVVLVFYASSTDTTTDEGTTMSCPYGEGFLTVLSKFGHEICAIAEQRFEHIPLKFFSPSQSIEDIVQWIRAIVLEN